MVFERFVLSEAAGFKFARDIPKNLSALFSKVGSTTIRDEGSHVTTFAIPVKNSKALQSGMDKIGKKINDKPSFATWDFGDWQVRLDKNLPRGGKPEQLFSLVKKGGSQLAQFQRNLTGTK